MATGGRDSFLHLGCCNHCDWTDSGFGWHCADTISDRDSDQCCSEQARQLEMTETSSSPHPSLQRIVHAIRFTFRGDAETSVIVWPRETGDLCIRLINSRRTWLHATAGDGVLLTRDGNTDRQYIESVELYRVSPAVNNGTIVSSAHAWLYEFEDKP